MEAYQQPTHRKLLEQLELCSLVIEEAHLRLEQPTDPEDKADLLIAVEDLTGEILDLLKTTRKYVWGPGDEMQPNHNEDCQD